MNRWIKRIGFTVLVILVLVCFAVIWLLEQTKIVPEFYTEATQNRSANTEAASEALTANVTKLQKDLARPGFWEATFNESDINAWLIEQLPLKFQQLQKAGARDPRICIKNEYLLAAARYSDSTLDTVLSCRLQIELTEQPNLLAVHVSELKAGAVSIPLSQFINEVTQETDQSGVDLRWDHTDEGPIALIQIPSQHPDYAHGPVIIESIRFTNGAVILSGRTGERAAGCYQPRSPIYRFVTYHSDENRNSKAGSKSRSVPKRR